MAMKEVNSIVGMHPMSDEYFSKTSEKLQVDGMNLLFKHLDAIIFASSGIPAFQHAATEHYESLAGVSAVSCMTESRK